VMPLWLQHPFAAGITLAGFTAVSVNDKWEPAFIDSSAGAIHKVGLLAFRCCRHAEIHVLVGKSAIFGCLFQH
jgi:Vacuolar sorting-associated protein 13, N-terminal